MGVLLESRGYAARTNVHCQVGVSRVELPAVGLGRPTLGWGRVDIVATAAATPLCARAMVIANSHSRVALVTVELNLITDRFVARLRELLRETSDPELVELPLVVFATHNHSGPSGFTGYALYDLPAGFDASIRDQLASAIVGGIRAAQASLEPATLSVGQALSPSAMASPRNRSARAFRSNAEVRAKGDSVASVALDTASLVAKDVNGRIFASIHWLGVHDTCIHADVGVLHSDAKGLASARLEKRSASGKDTRFRADAISLFAQGAAADVSPNHRWDATRRVLAGDACDDFGHAGLSADLHVRGALAAIDRARPVAANEIEIAIADERWDNGEADRAILGLSMAVGTEEGPGPLFAFRHAMRFVAAARRLTHPDNPRVPFLEVDRGLEGRLLGCVRLATAASWLAPMTELVGYFHRLHPQDGTALDRLVPKPAPLRAVRIGDVALICLPFEVSTMAARRIRNAAAHFAAGPVFVAGYADSYNGYLTTREEFMHQEYEGGASLYGPGTLDSVLASCARLGSQNWTGELAAGSEVERGHVA